MSNGVGLRKTPYKHKQSRSHNCHCAACTTPGCAYWPRTRPGHLDRHHPHPHPPTHTRSHLQRQQRPPAVAVLHHLRVRVHVRVVRASQACVEHTQTYVCAFVVYASRLPVGAPTRPAPLPVAAIPRPAQLVQPPSHPPILSPPPKPPSCLFRYYEGNPLPPPTHPPTQPPAPTHLNTRHDAAGDAQPCAAQREACGGRQAGGGHAGGQA